MDGLILLTALVIAFVVFEALAAGFGVDSRDQIGDDHARPYAH